MNQIIRLGSSQKKWGIQFSEYSNTLVFWVFLFLFQHEIYKSACLNCISSICKYLNYFRNNKICKNEALFLLELKNIQILFMNQMIKLHAPGVTDHNWIMFTPIETFYSLNLNTVIIPKWLTHLFVIS